MGHARLRATRLHGVHWRVEHAGGLLCQVSNCMLACGACWLWVVSWRCGGAWACGQGMVCGRQLQWCTEPAPFACTILNWSVMVAYAGFGG